MVINSYRDDWCIYRSSVMIDVVWPVIWSECTFNNTEPKPTPNPAPPERLEFVFEKHSRQTENALLGPELL